MDLGPLYLGSIIRTQSKIYRVLLRSAELGQSSFQTALYRWRVAWHQDDGKRSTVPEDTTPPCLSTPSSGSSRHGAVFPRSSSCPWWYTEWSSDIANNEPKIKDRPRARRPVRSTKNPERYGITSTSTSNWAIAGRSCYSYKVLCYCAVLFCMTKVVPRTEQVRFLASSLPLQSELLRFYGIIILFNRDV